MVSPEIFSGITEIKAVSCVFLRSVFKVLYQLIISGLDELRRKRLIYHNTVRGLILAMMNAELSWDQRIPENTVHSSRLVDDADSSGAGAWQQ